MNLAKIGKAIVWIYTQHLLTFTVGAALGAFVGMTTTAAVFTAMLKSRGLL